MSEERLYKAMVELCEALLELDGEKWYCLLDKIEEGESKITARLSIMKENNRSFGSVVDERRGGLIIEIKYKKTG